MLAFNLRSDLRNRPLGLREGWICVDEFAAELKKTRLFIGAGRKLYEGE
jgi:hypothetical protein